MYVLISILITAVLSNNYIVADVNITIDLISYGTLTTAASSLTDICYQLQARDMGLYHVDTVRLYERWAKGSLGTLSD